MRSRTVTEQHPPDRLRELREVIDLTGYYPEVVAASVAAALAGEPVVSFYVHHETTFDRDEVRRHLTVVALTPSRLIRAHTDEHNGDDLLPQPYTSTTSEAVGLADVRSVAVTRMVTQSQGADTTPAEAVVTIGWGAMTRIDLEPAGCADPQCDADHGYTGVAGPDDFSLRASEAADGPEAVARLLGFAEALSARTRRG